MVVKVEGESLSLALSGFMLVSRRPIVWGGNCGKLKVLSRELAGGISVVIAHGPARPRIECDSQADLSLSTGQASPGVSEVIGTPPGSDTVQKKLTGDSPAADISSTGQAKSYKAPRTFLPQWLVTIQRRTCKAPSLVATEKLPLLEMVEG